MINPITNTAGIDTSKTKLEVAVHDRAMRFQVANAPSGRRRLAEDLTAAGVTRVGIEATGGYERGVVADLRAAGFTVLVLQPAQVKAYARLHLRRAKNDALDAALIAACASVMEPPEIAPDERLSAMASHLTFVEQTEEDIARLKVRLEHVHDQRLRRMIMADIARLKTRRLAELARLAKLLRDHDDLARRLDLVLSVPGIGERTALALIIRMPELGRVSREEAAALAGLAPVRRRQRNPQRRPPHRRRTRSPAPIALRRRLAGRLPLEPGADRFLPPPHRARKAPQCRPDRLRQEAPHLRKHRRPARNPMDQTHCRDLMVATRSSTAAPRKVAAFLH